MVFLGFALNACSDLATPQPSATASVAQRPIRTTPTDNVTAIVTVMPAQPIPSSTPACEDAAPTRMILFERGQVSDEDTRVLNVRESPGIDAPILGTLTILEIFFVIDGPRCRDGYVWYYILHEAVEGWVAEGDFDVYYIEPYLPG